MSGDAFFRHEVLAARESQHLGTIRIGRNPSFAFVTLAAFAMATLLVAYAYFGEITRTAKLTGLLVPAEGTLALSAPQAGTLVDIRVKEGDSVALGQIIMTVGIDRSTAGGGTAALIALSMEQRRATMQAERTVAETQYRQRQQAAADRERSLETEARQAEAELDGARRRLELAKKSVERYQDLAKSGFVSEAQAQQKQEELLDLLGRESAAKRSLTSIRRDLQTLHAEESTNRSALEAQKVQIDRSLASLTQEDAENSARRELVITAPQAGMITALTANRGQLVQAGQSLVTLIPLAPDGRSSTLQAHLFAPSRTAGFVQPGQTVWIRYAAFPFQKFGMAKGAIESVSRTPLGAQELPVGQGQAIMNAAQSSEPMYRVTVALSSQEIQTYGQSQGLKAGMALEANVIQERRRVWEWMLEPVIAASGLSFSFLPANK